MIEKINLLKSKTENDNVRALCEKASSALDSTIYQNMPSDARVEYEKAVVKNLFEGLSSIEDEPTQEWLKNSKKFYLQQFKPISPMISNNLENIYPYPEEQLKKTIEEIKSYFDICKVRGI